MSNFYIERLQSALGWLATPTPLNEAPWGALALLNPRRNEAVADTMESAGFGLDSHLPTNTAELARLDELGVNPVVRSANKAFADALTSGALTQEFIELLELTETICLISTFNALAVACFFGLEGTARSILRSYNAMTRTFKSTRVARARRKSLRRANKARIEAQQAHMLACRLAKLALRNKRSAAWVKTSSVKTTKKAVRTETRSVLYAVAPPAIVDARAVVADWTPEGLKRRHDEALPLLNAIISDYPSALEGVNAEIARIDKVIAGIDAEKIKDDEKKAKKKPHSDRRTSAVSRKTELTSSYNLAKAHLDFATWEADQLKSEISPQERAEFAKAARLHSRRKHLTGDAREKAIREQHFKRYMGRGRYTSIEDARSAVEAWEKANTFDREFTVIKEVAVTPAKTAGEILYAIDEARAGYSGDVVCDIALNGATLASIKAVSGVGPKAIDKLVKALDADAWTDLDAETIASRVEIAVKKPARQEVTKILINAQGHFLTEIKRIESRAKILNHNINLELNLGDKSKLCRADVKAKVAESFAGEALTYVLTGEATSPDLLSEIVSSVMVSLTTGYVGSAHLAFEVPHLDKTERKAEIDLLSCAKAFAKRKPSRKMQVAMEVIDSNRNVNEWFNKIFSEIYSDDLAEIEPTEDKLKTCYGFYAMIDPIRFNDATKISTWVIDCLLAAKTFEDIKKLQNSTDALNKLFEKVGFITKNYGNDAWKASELYTGLVSLYHNNVVAATSVEAQNLSNELVQKNCYTKAAAMIVSEDAATVQVTQTMAGKDNVGAATIEKAMGCAGLQNTVSSLSLDLDRETTQGQLLSTLVQSGSVAIGSAGGGGATLTTGNDQATRLICSLTETMTGVQSYVMSPLNSSVRSEVWGTPETDLIAQDDIRVVIYDARKINLSERATLAGADGSNINSLLSNEPLIGQIRGLLARKDWKEVDIDKLVSALFKGQQYPAKILINDNGETYTILDAIKDGHLDQDALENENYQKWVEFARGTAREMGYFPFCGIDVANIKEKGKDHFSKIFDPNAESVKVDKYVEDKGGVLVLDPNTYGETLSFFSWVIIPSPYKSDMSASYQLSGMSPWKAMTLEEKQEQYKAFCESYCLKPDSDNHKQSLLRSVTNDLGLDLHNPQSAVKSPQSYLWRQFSTQGLPRNATRRIVMLDINFSGLSLAEVKKPKRDGSLRKVMHWRAPLLVPQAVMVNYEVDRKILKGWTENWGQLIADNESTLNLAYRHCEEVHNSRITKIKKKKGGVSGRPYTLEIFKEAIFALYDVACVMYIDSRIGFFSCADTAALQGDDDGDYIAWDTNPFAVANAERTKKFWQRVFKDNGISAPAIELDKKARLDYAKAWKSKADLLATGMYYPQLAHALFEAGLLLQDNDGFVPCILGWGFDTLIKWADRISSLDKRSGAKMWIRLASNPQGPVGIGSDMAVAALTSIAFKKEDGKILFATEMDKIKWQIYVCLAFGVQVSIDNAKRAYKVLLLVLAAAKRQDGSLLIDFSEELTKAFLDEWSVVGTEVGAVDFDTKSKKLWLGDKLMGILAKKQIVLPDEVYLDKAPSGTSSKEIDLFDPTNNCFSMDVFTTLGSIATGLDSMEVMLWKLKLPQLERMIKGHQETITALQERVDLFPEETHLKVGAQFVLRALAEDTPLSSDMRALAAAKESWASDAIKIGPVDQVIKVVRGKLLGNLRFGEKAPASAVYVRDVFSELNIKPVNSDLLFDAAIKDYNTTYTINGEGQYSYLELIKAFAVAEASVEDVDHTPFWQMMVDAYADQEELAHPTAIRIASYCADQVVYNLIEVMNSNITNCVNKVQEEQNFKDFVTKFAGLMRYSKEQKDVFADMLRPEVSSETFASATSARKPFLLIAAGLKAGFSAGMASSSVLKAYHDIIMEKLREGDYHRMPWSRAVEAANADIFKAAIYSIRIMRAVSATNATPDNGLITVSSSILNSETGKASRKFVTIEDHHRLNLMSLVWGKLSGVRNTLQELQVGKVPRRLDIDATAYKRVFNTAWALATQTGKPIVSYSLFGNKAPKSLSTLTLMGLLGGEFEAPNGARPYLVSKDSFRQKGAKWSAPTSWTLYVGNAPKDHKFHVQSSVNLIELLRKEGISLDQRFVSETYLESYLGGKMKYLEPIAAWDNDFICMRGAVLRFRKDKNGEHEDFPSFANYCVSTINGERTRISYDSFRLRYAIAFADRHLIKGFLQDAYGRLSDKLLVEFAEHGRAKIELMFSLRAAGNKMKYSMGNYVNETLAALPVPVEGYSRQIGNLMRKDPLFGDKVGAYLVSSDPDFLNKLCYMAANAVLLHKMTGVGTLDYEFKSSAVKAPQPHPKGGAQVDYGYEDYEGGYYDNTPVQPQVSSPAPQPQPQVQRQVSVQMPQTFPVAPVQPQVQMPAQHQDATQMFAMMQQQMSAMQAMLNAAAQPQVPAGRATLIVVDTAEAMTNLVVRAAKEKFSIVAGMFHQDSQRALMVKATANFCQHTLVQPEWDNELKARLLAAMRSQAHNVCLCVPTAEIANNLASGLRAAGIDVRS